MRIQTLKTLLDGNVKTPRGVIVEVADHRARALVAKGYAVEIPEIKDSVAAPLAVAKADNKPAKVVDNQDANEGASDDPFEAPLTGGRDGSEKPASSSEEALARPKRTYTRRKTESDSSQSTTPTD